MIKILFQKDLSQKIVISIIATLFLLFTYIFVDYFNPLNNLSSINSTIYNKNKAALDLFVIFLPVLFGLMSFLFILLMPMTIKSMSKKVVLFAISIILLLITYTTATNIVENESYLNSKRENFLENISDFYSQYSGTDGTKELIGYLNKNDYKSISEMNRKNLKYTDILLMTNLVNQANDPDIRKVYDESMQDGQISLLEKEKLDTMILKKTSETL
jgi:hypothetical protein